MSSIKSKAINSGIRGAGIDGAAGIVSHLRVSSKMKDYLNTTSNL
jgi:hypothetical protein